MIILTKVRRSRKKIYYSLTEIPPLLLLLVYESFNICHYAGQSAAVASLWSGPETGLARWVRIKKKIGKADFFFIEIGGFVIQVIK